MTRKMLLRRLVRLDLQVVTLPATRSLSVRSAHGNVVPIRPGRWSSTDLDELLGRLGVTNEEFQDSR